MGDLDIDGDHGDTYKFGKKVYFAISSIITNNEREYAKLRTKLGI